jgi:2,3-bisphosphoglycerate-independent phosphoglycerate mutase
MVVSRHGSYRFQTGLVTASLLRRGLRMADAMKIAREVRDSIAGKSEVSTEKLTQRVEDIVERRLGADVLARLKLDEDDDDVPMVETTRGTFPFSKGVVLRHLDTAGVGLEDAMALADDVERWARVQGEAALSEEHVHSQVASMLTDAHGEDFGRRYMLTTWVRGSDLPVIILIGGATGTGKSTLAMELAYRLGVVWVVSTDMIRETMRTVLSSELVPGLHDHSFRGMVLGGEVLSDPRERVLAGFHRQAAQVAVGVRAVIRRAIKENAHIIIEGTHLAPPYRQYLTPGDVAHLAGFVLAVPEEVKHRQRFPKRAGKEKQRSAGTYLDAFQSVRWIHDDLLRMAEDTEDVVLANNKLQKTLTGAVDYLSRELPVDDKDSGQEEVAEVAPHLLEVPTLFLVLDGLADEPSDALGGMTPLEAADTPTLRHLAGSGGQGQVITGRVEGEIPATDEGMLALLAGPDEATHLGRGLFEALGQGLPIPPGAVLFRGNMATIEADGAIVDRRAGRISAGVPDLMADLQDVPLDGGLTGRVFPGHEHRVVVMLQGPALSSMVDDTDPGDSASIQRFIDPHPSDESPEAARTAEALRALLRHARKVLSAHPHNAERLESGLPPANAIITRGASFAPLRRPRSAHGAMIAGCKTALGVARYIGLQTASSQAMTGNLDTDLDAKFDAAGKLLDEVDFVTIHIKGTDVAAHDRRPVEKRDFISAIDTALGRFLNSSAELSGNLRIVVSADHGTSSTTGNHIDHAVPLLLATWEADSEEQADFDEESASRGALGVLKRGELSQLLGLSRASSPAPTIIPPAP